LAGAYSIPYICLQQPWHLVAATATVGATKCHGCRHQLWQLVTILIINVLGSTNHSFAILFEHNVKTVLPYSAFTEK